MNQFKKWIPFFKEVPKMSVERIAQLFEQLKKNEVVTETNQEVVVESLREVAEVVIWGDKHDSRIFDFFLEKSMLNMFFEFLKQTTIFNVKKQLIQTLSMLIQNINTPNSLFFLLSNKHIDNFILHKFDFGNEELLAYYINFLKMISLRLDFILIQFFFTTKSTGEEQFPLFTETSRLVDHADPLVRIAVRTIFLKIISVPDQECGDYVSKVADSFFFTISNNLKKQCISIDKLAKKEDWKSVPKLSNALLDFTDELCFINDVFNAKKRQLRKLQQRLLDPTCVDREREEKALGKQNSEKKTSIPIPTPIPQATVAIGGFAPSSSLNSSSINSLNFSSSGAERKDSVTTINTPNNSVASPTPTPTSTPSSKKETAAPKPEDKNSKMEKDDEGDDEIVENDILCMKMSRSLIQVFIMFLLESILQDRFPKKTVVDYLAMQQNSQEKQVQRLENKPISSFQQKLVSLNNPANNNNNSASNNNNTLNSSSNSSPNPNNTLNSSKDVEKTPTSNNLIDDSTSKSAIEKNDSQDNQNSGISNNNENEFISQKTAMFLLGQIIQTFNFKPFLRQLVELMFVKLSSIFRDEIVTRFLDTNEEESMFGCTLVFLQNLLSNPQMGPFLHMTGLEPKVQQQPKKTKMILDPLTNMCLSPEKSDITEQNDTNLLKTPESNKMQKQNDNENEEINKTPSPLKLTVENENEEETSIEKNVLGAQLQQIEQHAINRELEAFSIDIIEKLLVKLSELDRIDLFSQIDAATSTPSNNNSSENNDQNLTDDLGSDCDSTSSSLSNGSSLSIYSNSSHTTSMNSISSPTKSNKSGSINSSSSNPNNLSSSLPTTQQYLTSLSQPNGNGSPNLLLQASSARYAASSSNSGASQDSLLNTSNSSIIIPSSSPATFSGVSAAETTGSLIPQTGISHFMNLQPGTPDSSKPVDDFNDYSSNSPQTPPSDQMMVIENSFSSYNEQGSAASRFSKEFYEQKERNSNSNAEKDANSGSDATNLPVGVMDFSKFSPVSIEPLIVEKKKKTVIAENRIPTNNNNIAPSSEGNSVLRTELEHQTKIQEEDKSINNSLTTPVSPITSVNTELAFPASSGPSSPAPGNSGTPGGANCANAEGFVIVEQSDLLQKPGTPSNAASNKFVRKKRRSIMLRHLIVQVLFSLTSPITNDSIHLIPSHKHMLKKKLRSVATELFSLFSRNEFLSLYSKMDFEFSVFKDQLKKLEISAKVDPRVLLLDAKEPETKSNDIPFEFRHYFMKSEEPKFLIGSFFLLRHVNFYLVKKPILASRSRENINKNNNLRSEKAELDVVFNVRPKYVSGKEIRMSEKEVYKFCVGVPRQTPGQDKLTILPKNHTRYVFFEEGYMYVIAPHQTKQNFGQITVALPQIFSATYYVKGNPNVIKIVTTKTNKQEKPQVLYSFYLYFKDVSGSKAIAVKKIVDEKIQNSISAKQTQFYSFLYFTKLFRKHALK